MAAMTGPTDRLEARLHALAEAAPWPPTPDVVGGATARLRARPAAAVRPGSLRPRAHRRLALALALIALLIAAAVAAAAILGLPGLRIGFTDTLPSAQVVDDAAQVRASLGTLGDLEAARAVLGDRLLVPEALGDPDEVYIGPSGARPRAALVYRVDAGGTPLMGDIALVVTEWLGGLDEAYARKWVSEPDGTAAEVQVGDSRGYWVGGVPHVLEYLEDESGIGRPVTRLVGDVLVWQKGPMVYRIESPLGLDATLALARTMRRAARPQPDPSGSSVSPRSAGRRQQPVQGRLPR